MQIYEAVINETPLHPPGPQLEESLFPRIAGGEREAFAALYEQCAGPVFAYALSVLRNHEDAEDAMQETFLKIRSAAHLYRPMGKPMAWIFTITKNICLMRCRQKSKAGVSLTEYSLEDMGFDRISDAEDRMVMQTAFSVLPEDTCQIIMLHVVAGMKHREIAQNLNMNLSTILSKYHRGMKKLRAELEGRL